MLAFKVRFPGDSQSLCQIPRFGSLLWALELSQQHENFFGIVVLQFVDRPSSSSVVGLMATSSKRTCTTCCASQHCYCQCSCPRGRPLLTHASADDPPTLKGRSGSVSCGDHCEGLENPPGRRAPSFSPQLSNPAQAPAVPLGAKHKSSEKSLRMGGRVGGRSSRACYFYPAAPSSPLWIDTLP